MTAFSEFPSTHPRSTAFLAGLFYAACMVLAFPPFDVWPLVLICQVPLFWCIGASSAKPRTLGVFVAAGVLPFWMFQEFWISRITGAGYAPMCFLLAVFAVVQVSITVIVLRRRQLRYAAIPASLVWCAVDVLRGEVTADGYPWYFEGHPLITWPPMASLGAILGVYAVTYLVILVNGLLADGIRLRRWGMVACAGLAAGLLPLASLWQHGSGAGAEIVRVASVQTNVPQAIKTGGSIADQVAEWKVLETLTREAMKFGPGVIVWPETMKPGLSLDVESVKAERNAQLYFRYQDAQGADQRFNSTMFVDRLLEMQRELNVPLIVGEEAFKGLRFPQNAEGGISVEYDARFNSAFVVVKGAAQSEHYDKLHLTPFGEYMPYIRSWPWLQNRLLAIGAQDMRFDLNEGERPVQLKVEVAIRSTSGVSTRECVIATPICFEIADAPTVQSLAKTADLIITLTNDGWFGSSDMTRLQHVQLARWRAVECGIPVVRCANTGISCAIDRHGYFLQPVAGNSMPQARELGLLVVDVPLERGETMYMKWGWATPWVIVAMAGVLLVWGLFGKVGISRTAPA